MVDPVSSSQPTLVAGFRRAAMLALDGEVHEMGHAEAATAIAALPPLIVCHAPATARRLGIDPFSALDILELFAFVRPAKPSLPTVSGVADALGLPMPETLEDAARLLARSAEELIAELDDIEQEQRSDAVLIASTMARGGWGWGTRVISALGAAGPPASDASGLDVWRRLSEWSEYMPETPPGNVPVASSEARARLAELLGGGAEDRPQQADYASAVSAAFAPRDERGKPNMVIAEAGTGVGKTIGYIAAASLWAERNEGPVWISTYTRNLQRQIDTELDRLCPDPAVKARRVVIRKGRENYLCLLNMEDAIARIGAQSDDARALGLLARWATNSRDGDMVGGDFPAWLADLLGYRNTLSLTDQRGECIYSSCRHYHKCFIERAVRRARRADIVVANHALVMTQAASGGLDDGFVPTRVIFDEGHHVFDAADSAFSAELGGIEGAELRRWLIGAQEGRRARSRGLKSRIEDIAVLDETSEARLHEVVEAAHALPAPGWRDRLASGQPVGAAEAFLAGVRSQVYACSSAPNSPYDLETETSPLGQGMLDAAKRLSDALGRLSRPMRVLAERLLAQLDERASELDPPTRNRIEAVSRGLRRRVDGQVEAWRSMLEGLETGAPETFVDWFAVRRTNGHDIDVTMHRHWIDPTEPFAHTVAEPAHGIVVTSATLRDGTGEEEADWQAAEQRTGAVHIEDGAMRAVATSPFDYPACTRVIVVTDVRKSDLGQVAAAYRELFFAAGGGALGLFTAISRLRQVHERIAPELEGGGLDLYAQHVDRLDITSLIEIFRAEEDSCLLGTDAVRDGVDVPGRSLRLIVFDRVPWPRPSILHRERRRVFSQTRYDDMITRLRLKQAYGRLLRRDTDAGVFVVLDPMLPSRLVGAFPDGVEIKRLGLADAIAQVQGFLDVHGS